MCASCGLPLSIYAVDALTKQFFFLSAFISSQECSYFAVLSLFSFHTIFIILFLVVFSSFVHSVFDVFLLLFVCGNCSRIKCTNRAHHTTPHHSNNNRIELEISDGGLVRECKCSNGSSSSSGNYTLPLLSRYKCLAMLEHTHTPIQTLTALRCLE